MHIYITFRLPDAARTLVADTLGPDDVCIWGQDLPETERKAAFLQADVVFGKPPADWLTDSQQLRWVQLYSTGFDDYLPLYRSEQRPDITITNLKGFFAQPVAESAIAGLMALYRRIDELARLQAEKKWVGGAMRPTMHLLHRKHVLVLGAGAIGQAIQQILNGFDCTVTFVRNSQPPTMADLDALLPYTDVVISVLPETVGTTDVFNEARFALLKPSAVIVNAGRGSLIDEDALLTALQSGQLAGAVLDVTRTEPLPADSPLWHCPNVLLTQHTGGGYDEEDMDKLRVFLKNFVKYKKGLPLENIVDFDRGY